MYPVRNQPLRNMIASKGQTQRMIAFALGISEGFLSSIINGYKKPSAETKKKLCLFLGESSEKLFGEVEELQGLLDVRRELQQEISDGEFSRELSRKLDAVEVLLGR